MIKDKYSRQRYEERKASNLCVLCGKPLDREGVVCTACNSKRTAYGRELYKKLQAVGVCPRCGKNLLYGDEKAVLSVGQNQPKPCQRNVLLMLKNTMSDKKHGEKHDTKKTRKMAYAHAVVKGKQTRGIPLAHFAEKQ
jgi:predicted amidophosphoribosyltransferase